MTPRHGGRPSRDRVMVSFYLARSGKAAVEALAAENELSKADTYRALLKMGLARAQKSPAEFLNALR